MTGPTREEAVAHILGLRHMSGDELHLPSAADFIERLAAENDALRERLEAAELAVNEPQKLREKRLVSRVSELEAALTEARAREAAAWEAGLVKPLEWDHDGRRFSLDDTMAMSSSYNWDGYECCRQEGYGLGCGYIIWPDRIASDRWNLYATFDGLYIQDIAGEEAAKAAAQADYEARILSALNLPTDATAALTAVKDAELERAAQICDDLAVGYRKQRAAVNALTDAAQDIRALRRNPKEGV